MLFPIIKVRDKESGHVHILGTNSHDTLHIDGGLQYYNLQCGDGTGRDGGFEFVGDVDEIEFVDFDTLIDIYKNQIKLDCEQERKIRDWIKETFDKYSEENRLDEDTDIKHT